MNAKLLVIRFSSFGDIIQCLPAASLWKQNFPTGEVHWAVRKEFEELVLAHPGVDKTHTLNRGAGLVELWRLIGDLRKEHYTHVYDAHNNLRSRIVSLFLWPTFFARRSKERFKRFLLFQFRISRFEVPYRGMMSFLKPLQKWQKSPHLASVKLPPPPVWKFSDISGIQKKLATLGDYVVLAPSAAWPMKRWPLSHWKEFVAKWKGPALIFVGGREDTFISEIAACAQIPFVNFAGELSLLQSAYVISRSQGLLSADTGTLHVADLLGVPTVALIGPTAFGFPSRPSSRVLEVPLPCRPCTKDGRGRCRMEVYQKCLVEISPERALTAFREEPRGERLPSGEERLPSGEERLPSGEERLPSGEERLPSREEKR